MSKEIVAAILTQIYIMHGGTEYVFLPGTPENEEYSSRWVVQSPGDCTAMRNRRRAWRTQNAT